MQRIIVFTYLIIIFSINLNGQSLLSLIPKFEEVWMKTYEGEEGILRKGKLKKVKDFSKPENLLKHIVRDYNATSLLEIQAPNKTKYETFPLYILGKKKEFNAQKDLRVELCHNFQYIDYEGNYKALIKYKIYVGKKLIKTYSLPCIYVKELKEWRMELLIGLAGNDFAEFITSLKSTPFGYLLGDESLTVVSFVEKIKQEVWQNNGFNYDSFRYDFIEKWKEENNTAKLDLFFEREIGWIEGNTLGFKKGTIFEMDNEE